MTTVDLQEVLDALDMASDEVEAFVDIESGEIVVVTQDDHMALESEDPDSWPDWQREHLPKCSAVLETGLPLPTAFDIDEWAMMKDFSESIEQESSRAALLDALGGRGAFGRFKRTAARLGLRERWFAYRQRELEAIAKDWLEQQGLEVR